MGRYDELIWQLECEYASSLTEKLTYLYNMMSARLEFGSNAVNYGSYTECCNWLFEQL